ncbi:hypothetical protein H0H92_009431 [Tricholoma furcatifolium]|nr:hypothetical protein H0H92_009431 [Tricholoma furcatifolium]
MQFGEWSTAYFTVAIAIHTFNSLVLQRRQSHIVSGIAITVGWIVALLSAAGPLINPKQFKFGSGYGANGLSCAIRPIYANAEFFYHLFPIFVASVLSAVLYSIIFLVLRGTLSIKGGVKLTLDPNERLTSGGIAENYQRFVARIARSMLWYPFAYNALLVPYSITVLLSLSGFTISFGSTIFAYVCWFMLGIVNVGLLYNTFRVIGPVLESTQKETTMWSSGMYEKYDSFRSGGPWRSSEQGYPISPHRSSTIASFGNASLQSIDQPLLPIHHERYAGIPSYYNYSSPPSIGRAITPVLDLSMQRSITPPEAVMHKFSPSTERSLGLHDRRGSNESMGLPAAPRRTRSPVLHQPSVENGARSPIEVQDPRSPSSRSRHRETEIVRMQGADPVSRAPRVLFTLNSQEDVALFATGCDGDIGGTSTTHLDLEESPAINESIGRKATVKFWGEMKLGVKPGMEGKVRGGYAGFRNKARPTLFGNMTEDVSMHEYLALRVRIGGDPKTRTSYFANIQTSGPMSSDVWQHRLYFQRHDNSWEDIFIPFNNFVRTNAGELSANQLVMAREEIRSIGISLLGGNSGIAGHYELGLDSIRIVNEEDVVRTPPGEPLPPLERDEPQDSR